MRHHWISWLLSAVLACLVSIPVAAAISRPAGVQVQHTPARPLAAKDAEIAAFFDAFVAQRTRELEIPGAAIVVVRDGRTILAKGYGVESLQGRRPIDVDRSLFRAASISKLMPWILVMQLVEEGRLDLDRDVNAYLDFEIPPAFGKPVTMRDLMTHSAGFSERFRGVFEQDVRTPLGTMLRNNVPNRAYAPGSRVAYSNYGAALAGYIVQRLRGQPWETIVRERILDRLDMHRATVAQPVPPPLAGHVVSTYLHGDAAPAPFRVTPLAPMGSLTASPRDMGRLLSMFMDEGSGAHGRVLSANSVATMTQTQKPLAPELPDGLGLGLLVGTYHGVRYAGHAGNMSTLATDLEWLPGRGLGWYYVFSSQGPNEAARQVRDDLLEAAIDRFAASNPAKPAARGPSTAAEVAGDYISTRRFHSGALQFSGLMNTTSVQREGAGGLVIESSGQETHWVPDGKDRFLERDSGIPMAVSRGAHGVVVGLGSAALYPAAEFERAPLLTQLVPILGVGTAGGRVLGLLATLVAWAQRRFGAPIPVTTAVSPRVRRAARVGGWLLACCVLAWAGFGLGLVIDFGVLFNSPRLLKLLLSLLAIATAPATLLLAVAAIAQWRQRRWAPRLASVAWVVAAGSLATLLYSLDVTDLSWSW
jgi:CubicO group peptidase (beta-lactamase class C family)